MSKLSIIRNCAIILLIAVILSLLSLPMGADSVDRENETVFQDSTQKFKDVKSGDWFRESVDYVLTFGLMKGTTETKFEPESKMTRAMLVTVLWRFEGSPSGFTNNFKDIPSGDWFADAVSWAGENGIVSGIGNGKFDPDGNITREQLATIMFRYSQYIDSMDEFDGDLLSFSDYSKVSNWAYEGLTWAVSIKLVRGTTDSKGKIILSPSSNATRAEVATVLTRYCSDDFFIHMWDDGTEVQDPTCTEKGQIDYVCLDCGAVKHTAVSALGHIRTNEKVIKKSTCNQNGSLSFYCTRCKETITESIDKLSHNWVAATCTTPKKCSLCGLSSGTALGHKWVNATCTTPKKCSVCGATSGTALGHKWVNATCTTPKKCSVCGATSGSALGHKWVNATCTTPKKCSVCGATSGTALGHNWSGEKCTRCGQANPSYVAPVTTVTYVANIDSHIFHRPSCSSVAKMSDEHRWDFTGTREELIGKGYTPCKRCKP